MPRPDTCLNESPHTREARAASTGRRVGPRPLLGFFGLALLGLAVSACGDPVDLPIACTEQFVYGISIQIVDGTSGAQRAAGSTLTVREGAYEEVVTQLFGTNNMVAAGERAGTYTVTVSRDGYQTWSQFDVDVDEDECHVIPVSLLAQLQPTP